MKRRVVFMVILAAAGAACTPPTPSADTVAPTLPATDTAAPASGPAEPNTTDALASSPVAVESASAQQAAPPVASATQPAETNAPATSPAPNVTTTPAEIENGRAAYIRTCAICHGPKGEGTPAGSALTTRDPAAIADRIVKGAINPGDRMPAMTGMLSEEEIDDVSNFVASGLPQ